MKLLQAFWRYWKSLSVWFFTAFVVLVILAAAVSYEHREGLADSFTKKFRINKLVYFEIFSDPTNAITREKQIKRWRRDKKNHLVNLQNPDWFDLSEEWYKPDPSAALRSGRDDKVGAGGVIK